MSRSCKKGCQTDGKRDTGIDRNTTMSPGPLTSDVLASLPQMESCFKGCPRATVPQRTPRNILNRLKSTSSSKCTCTQTKNNYLADCAESTIMSNIYTVCEFYDKM